MEKKCSGTEIAFKKTMRVAVGELNGRVAPRLELTEDFWIFTIVNGAIFSREKFSTKGVPFTVYPDIFSDLEVDLVLCGSLPPQLLFLFRARGIEVIWGVMGNIDDAISALLSGGMAFPPPGRRRWRWGKRKKWR